MQAQTLELFRLALSRLELFRVAVFLLCRLETRLPSLAGARFPKEFCDGVWIFLRSRHCSAASGASQGRLSCLRGHSTLGGMAKKTPVGTPWRRVRRRLASGSLKAAASAPRSSKRNGWPSAMAAQAGLEQSGRTNA